MKKLDLVSRIIIAKEINRRKKEFKFMQRKLEKNFPKEKIPFPENPSPENIINYGISKFYKERIVNRDREMHVNNIRKLWKEISTLQALAQIQKPYIFYVLEYNNKKYVLTPDEGNKIESKISSKEKLDYYDHSLLEKRIMYDEEFLSKLNWYTNLPILEKIF